MFAGLFGKLALGLLWGRVKSNAVRDWQAIPPKVKKWLLIALAALVLFFAHQWYAHRQLKAQYQAGYKQAQVDDAEKARKAAAKLNTKTTGIAVDERSKKDAEVRHNADVADALRVRGPGKAVCPRLPASPDGHLQSAPVADAAGHQMPADDRAAVPWDWLVQRGQEHDDLLAEVKAWHRWHERILDAWPKADDKPR